MDEKTAAGIQAQLTGLSKAVAEATEQRKAKGRYASVMAKNLKLGDVLDLPEWGVELPLTGWSKLGDSVLLSSGLQIFTLHGTTRVRVYRSADA